MSGTSDNKRVAKNAFILYLRMFFTMGVTIYTSRVVLNALGVEDYGIHNVAGGLISMFTFVNSAMNSTCQRFLNFAMGKGDQAYVRKVFSTSIQLQVFLSLIVIILAETIGLWFLKEKMVIPYERRDAAMWVYQFSIATSLAGFIFVPYTSVIIAREKMSVFAYLSIVTVTLRLIIAYLVKFSPWDKLKFYSVLLFVLTLSIKLVYRWYCKRHYEEVRYKNEIDKKLIGEMTGFAGWSFFGLFAGVSCSQGVNMVLNLFFGPVVNAARGVANQVQLAVKEFVGSFQSAINPQITKTYANAEIGRMHGLMFRSAKFSFFLLWIITLPILLETKYILTIWLKTVPDHAVIFTQLMLAISLLYALTNPCLIAAQATGKVKRYQLVSSMILILLLPVSYVLLKIGLPAHSVFIAQFFFELLTLIAQILMLRKLVKINIGVFLRKVVLPILLVLVITPLFPWFVRSLVREGFLRLLVVVFSSILSVGGIVFLIGFTKDERRFVKEIVVNLLVNRFHLKLNRA